MIPTSQLIALTLFALTTSITPGPNNFMLMMSGTNFGYKKTIPHIFGVSIGFPVLVIFMGFGLGKVFKTWPTTELYLQVLSALILLYLAYRIFQTKSLDQNQENLTGPIKFWEAFLFQMVNPKGWSVAIACITLYTQDQSLIQILTICLVYLVINLPCSSLWVLLGKKINLFLSNPLREKVFKMTMAICLISTLFVAKI